MQVVVVIHNIKGMVFEKPLRNGPYGFQRHDVIPEPVIYGSRHVQFSIRVKCVRLQVQGRCEENKLPDPVFVQGGVHCPP